MADHRTIYMGRSPPRSRRLYRRMMFPGRRPYLSQDSSLLLGESTDLPLLVVPLTPGSPVVEEKGRPPGFVRLAPDALFGIPRIVRWTMLRHPASSVFLWTIHVSWSGLAFRNRLVCWRWDLGGGSTRCHGIRLWMRPYSYIRMFACWPQIWIFWTSIPSHCRAQRQRWWSWASVPVIFRRRTLRRGPKSVVLSSRWRLWVCGDPRWIQSSWFRTLSSVWSDGSWTMCLDLSLFYLCILYYFQQLLGRFGFC